MERVIITKDLCKTYGNGDTMIEALKNCNIEIFSGEVVAIVGASGSGKSTLLHLLGGLDKPTGGSVLYKDEDIYKKSDFDLSVFRRRNVGFVFQNYNLVPELTAKENICLPVMLDNKKVDDSYFNEITEILDISKRLTHLPGELSGGQQQRVAIARAVINKPSAIFSDEPTGNLDSKSGQEVMNLIKHLAKELGIAQVIVTHDANIAKQADRIIKITDGIVEAGATIDWI